MAEKKEKRYVSDNAHLMAEWNWEKNDGIELDPKTLTLGSGKKAWWICSKGHEWQAQISSRSIGSGCPECGKLLAVENRKGKTAKKTTKQFIQELNNVNTNIKIIGEYVSCKNRISCLCDICGCNWDAIPYLLLKGSGCPNCTKIARKNYRRYTSESYKEKLFQVNPYIELLSSFTKSTEVIEVKCIRCGNAWTSKAYRLLQGTGCPKCAHKIGAQNNRGKTGLKSYDTFISELAQVDNSIEVVGKYINTHTNISCKCNRCNRVWSAKPYSLLQGHGCPRCAKSGTSFMEQFIKSSFEVALGEDSVLSRDKTAIGMELDIYIPCLKIAIEPGNWFLHKKSLNRDKTKRERCKEKGIRLITIYDKFSLTEQIPFENDCFVFNDDLNKADHSVIRDLVKRLFEIANIQYRLSDSQWSTIERQSYENAKAKTHEDFVESMSALHPTIEVLGKYVNANRRLLVKCTVCGFEWDGVPASMLAGDGCRKCGTKLAHKKFVKEQDEFEEQVRKANPDIEIIGTYTGRHNPIQAKCRICGHIWNPRASSLLRGSNHKGWKTIHMNCLDKESENI